MNQRWKWIWGSVLVLIWAGLLWVFIRANGVLSLEQILRFRPEKLWAAVLVMLGLYVLKSADFLVFSPILYAACGIIFPMWLAFCVNLAGMVIMLSIPFGVGKLFGTPAAEYLAEKHPKLKEGRKVRERGDFLIVLLLRAIGIPLHVVSVYMGAVGCRFGKYLLASVLGLLPEMITFTVMGMSASDVTSPAFQTALWTRVGIALVSVLIYARVRKKM